MSAEKRARKGIRLEAKVQERNGDWGFVQSLIPFDFFVQGLLSAGDDIEKASVRITNWQGEQLEESRGGLTEQILLSFLRGNEHEGMACAISNGVLFKACVVYPRGLMLVQVEDEAFFAIRVAGKWRELVLPDGWQINDKDGAIVWEDKRLAVPPWDGEFYPWPVVFPKRCQSLMRLVRLLMPGNSNPLSGLLRTDSGAERTLACQLRDELEVMKMDAQRELLAFVEDCFARGLTEADLL